MFKFIILNKQIGDEVLSTDSWADVKNFFSARHKALEADGLTHAEAVSRVNSIYEIFSEI